jgi:hypothetical protein
MSRLIALTLLCCAGVLAPASIHSQAIPTTGTQKGVQTQGQSLPAAVPEHAPPTHVFIPLAVQKITPGQLELLKLEGEFSEAVTNGGGKAFSSWFADDGVTLNNGKPAVLGRTAITATANWDPAQYKLSWYAEGAQ